MPNPVVSQDVRDILRLRSPAAWLLVGMFFATCLSMGLWNDEGVDHIWVIVLAAVLFAVAALGVMYLPGDPLPTWAGALLAAASPVMALLVVSQLPTPPFNAQQHWFFAATVAYLTFMCVRGAVVWAWIGLACRFAVYIGWCVVTGQGALTGLTQSAVDIAPLLMATFFAYTVRPTARSIFQLREQANLSAASEAASAAVLEERDAQLDRLDVIARPLLEVIASGRPLSRAEQDDCRLLEARLRDRLRAGLLIDDGVADAAREARRRGVTVVLLDDGGLDDSTPSVRESARGAARSALTLARSGKVSARVLPPGRPMVATILVNDGDSEYHVEVDRAGVVHSDQFVSVGNFDPTTLGLEDSDTTMPGKGIH
ncbi:hypothetical protein [Antrihabitans cavernicola]|uniref:Uncharacterized protein n=1 Tax=Antrihabitans cavernicola TaxID=2495913 RepID=A0A5A7S6C5_9NOCA|nr:hypothetical protein [Spelaeibacter cavernicola]KAA0018480.1 hypothetical protein FOY51_23655 [Spelaeibacter cavernicola]